jgi:hypothetical protein
MLRTFGGAAWLGCHAVRRDSEGAMEGEIAASATTDTARTDVRASREVRIIWTIPMWPPRQRSPHTFGVLKVGSLGFSFDGAA